MNRQGLPLQNRVVIGVILCAGAFGVEWLTGSDWKFGAVAAALWTLAILAARTAARFALGGFRGWRYWGMGVILAAAALTALMILLFLGSWRSTLIIAISIPLSVLASLAVLSAIGERSRGSDRQCRLMNCQR